MSLSLSTWFLSWVAPNSKNGSQINIHYCSLNEKTMVGDVFMHAKKSRLVSRTSFERDHFNFQSDCN